MSLPINFWRVGFSDLEGEHGLQDKANLGLNFSYVNNFIEIT